MDILAALLSWLLLYKYIALFAIVYTGAILSPASRERHAPRRRSIFGQHYFNFWISLAIAVIANTLRRSLGICHHAALGHRRDARASSR